MNEKQALELMLSSGSTAEWNANYEKVKEALGHYPSFWFSAIVQSGITDRTLSECGELAIIKGITYGIKPLLPPIYGRPTCLPHLGDDERVVGIYDKGRGKKSMVCRSLGDMHKLYDSYTHGVIVTLHWCIVNK